MNFPRYWARGESGGFISWRWSQTSLAEAQSLANAAARHIAEHIGRNRERLKRYGYGERPLREEVLHEMKDGKGDVAAIVTRNAYGCRVLNTARVLFVDVDIPQLEEGSGFAFFRKLFRKASAEELLAAALAKVEAWTQQHREWGWRVYRTRAGLRLLATHALFDPETAVANGVFDFVGADPLYRRLCQNQKCFRARLTPKPWRLDVGKLHWSWPWQNIETENAFREWERDYQAESARHATCELVRQTGNRELHPDVQAIVRLHDETTRAESKLPLA